MEIKNILISGKPGCGKTSLIMEIIKELDLPVQGFYTQEIRKKGQRVGFSISSLSGKKGILAHQDFQSPYKVGKYGVNLKDLEEIGTKSILEALRENKVCLIDEVGNMEMKSEKFKKAVLAALDSKNKILGTIKFTPHRIYSGAGLIPDPFTDKIKQRKDTKILELTKENRKEIKTIIIKFLEY